MSEHLVGGLRCGEATELAAGFVLGALDPVEMAAVRAHLAGCPEAHAEFAELGSVLPALLESVPQVEPAAGLRDRILAIAREEQAAAAAALAASAAAHVVPAPAAAVQPRPRPQIAEPGRSRDVFGFLRVGRPAWALAGVAAVLVIAVLGARTLQLQQERDSLAAYQRGVAAVMDLATRPDTQVAVLTAGSGVAGPTGIAAVAGDGTVRIAMFGLAPTSGSQVYEAWSITTTTGPQPIGSFTVGSAGAGLLATSTTSTSGVVLALTLEPGPGATVPTAPILAKGMAQIAG